ncbi:hypothetical protein K466DRAFT_143259 [Polyporus arcularius HHB13444]|uniref:F-box domain-containing protein n=1 Tax=Polyporus arcularius HHB13444 TaxID=1314778 RepID=A0A5C3PCI4_9APHY|nr:hypothetical protein K466DRAFT_143259 [Polyporus arcularius HHB13444]
MALGTAQALACEDITTEVFGYLEDGGRGTLASAARVSRTLSHPALAALWRRQNNILFLFRVVPTFHRDEASNTHIFGADPTKEEWERFMSYARLVRKLDALAVRRIHSAAWNSVTQYVGHMPLFPHLRRLRRLRVDADLPAESLHHILPPTLRHVHLIPGDGVQGVLGRVVLSRLMHVHEFTIACPRLGKDDEPREIPFWTFANMRALAVQDVDLTPEKMRGLAALPHLRSLKMEVRSFTNGRMEAPPYVFLPLDTLKLKWKASLGDIRAFITSTSFPQLMVVNLITTRAAQDDGVYTIIRAALSKLVRGCSHSLRALSFVLDDDSSTGMSDLDGIFDVVVEELMQCSCLHTLELSIYVPSALGMSLRVYDRDIRRITSSWPALRTLVLNVKWSYREADSVLQHFPDDDPPPTVHTLAKFAQAHSQLKHLRLPYVCIPDDMVGDDGDTLLLDSLPVLDHGLETLWLTKWGVLKLASTDTDESTLDQQAQAMKKYQQPVFEFAYLLDRLFPHLHATREVNLKRSWDPNIMKPMMSTVNRGADLPSCGI